MNLDNVLDIFGRSIEIVTKCIEDRRKESILNRPLTDSTTDKGVIYIGEPDIEAVFQELLQMQLLGDKGSILAYGGTLYDELYDRVIANKRRGVEASIIDILRPFKEYSYSMYPETLCKKILDIFEDATNESCVKYLYQATPEIAINAKAIVVEQEKTEAYARGEYFESYIDTILTNDILRKVTTYLHCYVIDFAVMLDCVLLQNGYDLLELQSLHNIKLIDEHKEILLSKYIGSDGDDYVKQLISNVCKEKQSQYPNLQLTAEIDSPEARKYFNRAVENKYIEPTSNGGRILVRQAELGYICMKIYSPPRPISYLEKFFNVYKLSASITQASYEAKRADVKQWRTEIDSKIFYD